MSVKMAVEARWPYRGAGVASACTHEGAGEKPPLSRQGRIEKGKEALTRARGPLGRRSAIDALYAAEPDQQVEPRQAGSSLCAERRGSRRSGLRQLQILAV